MSPPPPGFAVKIKQLCVRTGPRVMLAALLLLALSSKSVTGGRGDDDEGREVKGPAQRRWRGILLPSAEPAGSETWVCLPPAQTMPALQEAARYAGDICLVVKCLIF